jgi:hypothetical protein
MKRIDSFDVCTFILHILLVLTVAIGILGIMAIIGSYKQKECFIEQNEYCVVLNKDSHLVTQVAGKFVTTRSVHRIDAVGLTTQDTVLIDVNRRLFDNVEIGDTLKTINLR